LNTLKRRLHLR